ncbi:MAG: c-type cytochrome [Planctomycetaceae bacterium]|nr:c-type cytochrome [Planctomycetaceae bacterium]
MKRFTRFLTALALASASSFAMADDIFTWNFDKPDAGWTPNGDTELSVKDGSLHLKSKGKDPYFSAPVDGRAGEHKLVISAKFRGNADIQVFWTTEASPNTSEDKSVRTELRGSDKEFRSAKVYFATDSPVTSLRIDPFSRGGEMEIDAIVLTDEAAPIPQATPVKDIKVAEGFEVELLYSVPYEKMGSWVCMTPDPKGRLIVSDQYGKLYRLTPPAKGSSDAMKIELINVDVGMAQGLLCAFDSLYVMTNSGDAPRVGLHRVRDTNGDDQYDTAEHVRVLQGGNEHGPHAIILSPDKKSLLVACGNHTPVTDFSQSRVPRIWGEDQLLPRMWDAGGHAVGVLAPGGWIAQVSPDGKDWQLVASGFRNEYDIALNPQGELFTYDADMEWDVGSPWYRPTRVNHVTSGAEFGWRSGTGKWPAYYPDSLGSVVDVGPGSPTGITFGTGAKFPAKYQDSLFISDWSYGVIYAVHMKPSGSTYTGELERFISAAPLPVTDVIVNPADQAMYFTIGGRKTQSGLYRVTYKGKDSTAPVTASKDSGEEQRTLRHKLEALHHDGASDAIATAWPYLGHADRTIRFAARTAIEHQPVASWTQKALEEDSSVDAKLNALLALARCGDKSQQMPLLTSMREIDGSKLSESQMLDALRVLGLCFIRMGEPEPGVAQDVAKVLNYYYPAKSPTLNRELCRMLVYLNDEQVAGKTLALLAKAPTQEEQIHYAYCLRALKSHWTIEQRKEYFQWFVTSTTLRGGNSFSGFIKNIRQEAIDRLTDAEKTALKDVLEAQPTGAAVLVEASTRPVVKEWTVDDFLADVEAGLTGRNYDNGRKMFQVTACFKCHRFAGDGGIVGPELTAVARRYNARTLLESIIEPSKVISDQYEANIFVLDSGKQVAGRVVNLNGDRIMVCENMLEPGNLTQVAREEIEETLVSKVSMMPAGLINTLTKEEVLDLVAYLQSGGDPDSPVFTGAKKTAAVTEPMEKPMFTDAGHTVDSLDLVKQRVEANEAILVDVREQDEWDAGHLKVATFLPLSKVKDGSATTDLEKLPKNKPIYLHCKAGGRVLMCAEMLMGKGWDIRPLRTGFDGLVKAGFPKAE